MDQLFLLHPNFKDNRIEPENQLYYCPHCAMIEGVIKYFPELDQLIDINYVDFPRPRKNIIDLIGEENQGCPVLVIPNSSKNQSDYPYFKSHGDHLFCNDKYDIVKYLASKYSIALPHP